MNTFVTQMPQGRRLSALSRSTAAVCRGLSRMGASVWHAMQASGRGRAQAELRKLTETCERSQPTLARELRAAAAFDPLR